MAALASISCQSKINFHPIFSANIYSFFKFLFRNEKIPRKRLFLWKKIKNRKFPIFIVHGNLKLIQNALLANNSGLSRS